MQTTLVQEVLAGLGVELPEPELRLTVDGIPVYGFDLGEDRAMATWQQLRDVHDQTGLWPFVSHDGPEEWCTWSQADPGGPGRLAGALRTDPHELLAELVSAYWEKCLSYADGRTDVIDELAEQFDPQRLAPALGPTPAGPLPARGRTTETAANPADWLCLVPADGGYELPALLGGPLTVDWIGSPRHPDLTLTDHVAVLRSWHQRYGAELSYLGTTAIELTVTDPPLPADEAARVAIEHYAYCDDLSQRIGDPIAVAESQVRSARWYFWWD